MTSGLDNSGDEVSKYLQSQMLTKWKVYEKERKESIFRNNNFVSKPTQFTLQDYIRKDLNLKKRPSMNLTRLYQTMSLSNTEMDQVMRILDNSRRKFTNEQIEKYHRFLIRLFAVSYAIDIPYIEINFKEKNKTCQYSYFVAKGDGTYPTEVFNNQNTPFDEFPKDQKFCLFYHHRYVYVFEGEEVKDDDIKKKFKLLTIGETNKKFCFSKTEKRNNSKGYVDQKPYIIGKTNFFDTGIICNWMNETINGEKENKLILSPFKDSQTIEIVITDVYGEGNCLIYHFYIIMKEYIENFDMIDDPKVFVPLI